MIKTDQTSLSRSVKIVLWTWPSFSVEIFFCDVLTMFDVGDEIAEVMAFSHLGKSEKVDPKVTRSNPRASVIS